MAVKTPEGLILNGDELLDVVKRMGIDFDDIKVEELDVDDYFARPWLEEYGAKTYAITIEHDHDIDSPYSDPDYWQDAIAQYVSAEHPEVCVDEDGWLSNVVFHV